METIAIDGHDYTAYQSVENTDLYLRVTRYWTAWNSLEPDDKGARLVRVSRRFDQLDWVDGFKTQEERYLDQRVKNATALFSAITIEEPESVEPGEESMALESVSAEGVDLNFQERSPDVPVPSVSDDSVAAARLGIPAAVYSLIKEIVTLDPTPISNARSIGSPRGRSGRRRMPNPSRGWCESDFSGYGC